MAVLRYLIQLSMKKVIKPCAANLVSDKVLRPARIPAPAIDINLMSLMLFSNSYVWLFIAWQRKYSLKPRIELFSSRFNKFSRVRKNFKSAVKVFRAGDKFWLPFNFLYDTSEARDLDIF